MTCSPDVAGKRSDQSRLLSSFIGEIFEYAMGREASALAQLQLGDRIARLAVPAGKPLPRACVRRAILQACNLRRNERPHGYEPCESGGIRHVRNKLGHQERDLPLNGGFNRPNFRFTAWPYKPRRSDFSRRSSRNAGPRSVVTDGLRAYSAAMNEIGAAAVRHEAGGRLTIARRIRISRFDDANGRCSAFEVRRRCRSSAQFMPSAQPIQSRAQCRDKASHKQRRSAAFAEWRALAA